MKKTEIPISYTKQIKMELIDGLPILTAIDILLAKDTREFLGLPKNSAPFSFVSASTDELLDSSGENYVINSDKLSPLLSHEPEHNFLKSFKDAISFNVFSGSVRQKEKTVFYESDSRQLTQFKKLLLRLFGNFETTEFNYFLSIIQKKPNQPFLIIYGHGGIIENSSLRGVEKIMGGVTEETFGEYVEINKLLRYTTFKKNFSAVLVISCSMGLVDISPIKGSVIFASPDLITLRNQNKVVIFE